MKKKQNQKELCPVCAGKKKVKDKKTSLLRDCVACRGEGLMPKSKFKKNAVYDPFNPRGI